jgi:hypothetical protein
MCPHHTNEHKMKGCRSLICDYLRHCLVIRHPSLIIYFGPSKTPVRGAGVSSARHFDSIQ